MSRQDAAAIADEAAAWVAKMDADGWCDADEAALGRWMVADPRRRGALLQAQAAWIALDVRPAAVAATPLLRRRTMMQLAGGALAASLAGGVFLLTRGITYRTQLGEIRRVPLADGSTATINTGSEVQVVLADRRRTVTIAQGEAWFRVAKDATRPFVVEAGPVVVQAVGTAFSVRRRDHGADVVVTEGVVEVWTAQADGYRTSLSAGQSAFVGDNAAVRINKEEPSAVDRTLAWRTGAIDIGGQTLAAAIGEFNRYNRRKLELADQRLAGEQIDGLFHTDDPEGFARAIRASFNVEVDLADDRVIRIGSPRK
jgi:transmembrane sensor